MPTVFHVSMRLTANDGHKILHKELLADIRLEKNDDKTKRHPQTPQDLYDVSDSESLNKLGGLDESNSH